MKMKMKTKIMFAMASLLGFIGIEIIVYLATHHYLDSNFAAFQGFFWGIFCFGLIITGLAALFSFLDDY